MRMGWRVAVACFAMLLCLLPALTQASTRPTPVRVTPRPTPKPKVVPLRLAIPEGSPQVDPALVSDEEDVELANLLYSGLVRLDTAYRVVPADAARYSISSDRRHYIFHLRPNLRFSNGDPVGASDFKFAMTRSLLTGLKSSTAPVYLLDIQGASEVLTGKAKSVSGIKVIDPLTLEIITRWAVPYFLMELTYPTSYALDEKAVRKLGSADNTRWYSNPVGSGPYKLKSWSPNTKMVLVPNKYFAGSKPMVKEIDIALGPLQGTGPDLYKYVRQNLDVVNLGYDTTLLGQPGIHETDSLSIDGIYLNVKMAPFSNRNLRRALTLALPRDALVTSAMAHAVTPFTGYVPRGEWGYDAQLKTLPYDLARARSELKAAGFPGGKGFPATTLYFADLPSNPGIAKLAQSIAKTWHKNLHVNIDTKGLEYSSLLTKSAQNSLPLYLSGWTADYPDPHDWLSLQWKSDALNNNVHYANKQFDDMVSTADVTWEPKRRLQLYDSAQSMLVQDGAWIPLYIPHRLTYIRPTVGNLYLTGYGVMPRSGSWARVKLNSSSSKTVRRR
ncbi:MAG TPA: peptide ABC transporter substrate-binding protein [Chloroflexota bacterium]